MKKAIGIAILMVLMLVAVLGTTASATVSATENIGFTDLNVEWSSSPTGQKITLSVWWTMNAAANNLAGLTVNITVITATQTKSISEGTIVYANQHFSVPTAWKFEEWKETFANAGTYTIKVEFIDITEPAGSNALDNSITIQQDIGQGIISSLLNGFYSVTFTISKAVASTGIGFLGEIPYLPVIIIIVVIVIVYLLYRRYKRKRNTPQPVRRIAQTYRETTSYPPYPPSNPPNYGDQY
jgi:hypothetical protein